MKSLLVIFTIRHNTGFLGNEVFHMQLSLAATWGHQSVKLNESLQ